jgi:GAF domain-containing protein
LRPESDAGTDLPAALARGRALVAAARVISADGHDLDAVLDALTEEAQRLLAADAVSLQLASPAFGFVVQRPNPLLAPGAPMGVVGSPFVAAGLVQLAIDTRRPIYSVDFQQDERVPQTIRAELRKVSSRVVVPLCVGDALQGILYIDWTSIRAVTPDDLEVAEALGAHAAAAIRTARLVEEVMLARAEAEQRARLEGALATARTVAHELNNQLQFLTGYGSLLAARLGGEEAAMAREIAGAARDMAAVVRRLLLIVRFEEVDTPVGPALDLEAASGEPPG